jgi:hypothetical protein
VKWLAHAVAGDLAETGERRFGGYGTEVWLDREGLQELGCAHGFSESIDAMRMRLRGQEIEPLVDVVAFQQAVGGQLASADAVGASVGEQDCESASEEELRVSGHADAVVGYTVEEDHGVAVAVPRMDGPGTESDGVWRGDGNGFEVGIEMVGNLTRCGFFFWSQRAAGGM